MYHDYKTSKEIAVAYSFRAIVMAAMRAAGELEDIQLLERIFPDIAAEYDARQHSVNGLLPHEIEALPRITDLG